jgi:hypothetical protein
MTGLLLLYFLSLYKVDTSFESENKLSLLQRCLDKGKDELLETVEREGALITKLKRSRSVYASEAQMYEFFTR